MTKPLVSSLSNIILEQIYKEFAQRFTRNNIDRFSEKRYSSLSKTRAEEGILRLTTRRYKLRALRTHLTTSHGPVAPLSVPTCGVEHYYCRMVSHKTPTTTSQTLSDSARTPRTPDYRSLREQREGSAWHDKYSMLFREDFKLTKKCANIETSPYLHPPPHTHTGLWNIGM